MKKVFDQLSGEGLSGVQSAAFRSGDMFLQTLGQQSFAWRAGQRVGLPGEGAPLGYTAQNNAAMTDAFAKLPVKAPRATTPVVGGTWSVWGSYFGARERINGDAPPVVGMGTYDGTTDGGAFGVDYQVSPDLLLGAGIGASFTRFNVAERSTVGNVDGLHVGLYGMKTWSSAYLSALATYAHFENRTSRIIAGVGPTEIANANFSAEQFGGRVEFGNTWRMAAYDVTPFAAVQPLHFRQKAFIDNTARRRHRRAGRPRAERGGARDHVRADLLGPACQQQHGAAERHRLVALRGGLLGARIQSRPAGELIVPHASGRGVHRGGRAGGQRLRRGSRAARASISRPTSRS